MKPIFQAHRCLSANELQQYSTGQLPREERFRVENHLLDCALCSDAVEGRRASSDRAGAALPSANTFLATLAEAPTAPAETPVRPLPRRRPWLQWVAAASIAALAAVGAWYVQETDKHDRLVDYDTPDPTIINPRGQTRPLRSDPLDVAMEAYDRADYAESAALFEAIVQLDPANEDALYYGGLSQLEAGDTAAAIQLFERALKIGQKYPEQVLFHLAIAHLQQHRTGRARAYLRELARDENGLYYGRAKEMLEELTD